MKDPNTICECPQCGAKFYYWEGYNAGINADMSSVRVCSKACMRARLPEVQILHLVPDANITDCELQPSVELDNQCESEYNRFAQ